MGLGPPASRGPGGAEGSAGVPRGRGSRGSGRPLGSPGLRGAGMRAARRLVRGDGRGAAELRHPVRRGTAVLPAAGGGLSSAGPGLMGAARRVVALFSFCAFTFSCEGSRVRLAASIGGSK